LTYFDYKSIQNTGKIQANVHVTWRQIGSKNKANLA